MGGWEVGFSLCPWSRWLSDALGTLRRLRQRARKCGCRGQGNGCVVTLTAESWLAFGSQTAVSVKPGIVRQAEIMVWKHVVSKALLSLDLTWPDLTDWQRRPKCSWGLFETGASGVKTQWLLKVCKPNTLRTQRDLILGRLGCDCASCSIFDYCLHMTGCVDKEARTWGLSLAAQAAAEPFPLLSCAVRTAGGRDRPPKRHTHRCISLSVSCFCFLHDFTLSCLSHNDQHEWLCVFKGQDSRLILQYVRHITWRHYITPQAMVPQCTRKLTDLLSTVELVNVWIKSVEWF